MRESKTKVYAIGHTECFMKILLIIQWGLMKAKHSLCWWLSIIDMLKKASTRLYIPNAVTNVTVNSNHNSEIKT